MPETFTIEIDAKRYKILNTMMNAVKLVPFDSFRTFMYDHGLTNEEKQLFDEISDKGHALNMCTSPGCMKPQPKDVQAL